MTGLLVFWDQKIVGTLTRHKGGRVVFQYDKGLMASDGRSISISLPCQQEKFAPGVSTAFFENLLPESRARSILARNHRFDKKDTFAFLNTFGEDCAGALSIIPEEKEPDFTTGQYKCIDSELIEILDKIRKDPKNHSLYPEIKDVRLSIAGVQDKLPVYLKEGRFYLPLNSGSATTHIIKPANADFPELTKNETFCMALAGKSGLPVPESELITLAGYELYAVRRYDRIIRPDEAIERLHQEDFCQAKGYPVDRKYQETGGPGFRECRELIDEYLSDDGPDVRINVCRVMAFNYLIGNYDAHGKNFSIIHDKQLRFAPFYDLLSTQVYPALTPRFAMAIGDTYRAERIKIHSLEKFAKTMNFRFSFLNEIIEETLTAVGSQLAPLLGEHEKQYGKSIVYDELYEKIQKNMRSMKKIQESRRISG
jgi:serine/threonine-protein kinase HipA